MCSIAIEDRNQYVISMNKGAEITCFIIIVDDGSAARLPLAPAAKSKAASPHALPIQSVKIGILTYLRLVKI